MWMRVGCLTSNRSPNFELNGLETAREKIMQLRENRGIRKATRRRTLDDVMGC